MHSMSFTGFSAAWIDVPNAIKDARKGLPVSSLDLDRNVEHLELETDCSCAQSRPLM
jgi:hypothetical protein